MALASFSIGNLAVGSHNISFTYSGDDNDSGSTSAVVTQTVNPVSTVTSISSSTSTSVFGQSVTFTAGVTPNTATGTFTFKDGTKTLGSAALSGGSAAFSINSLAVGSHSITAVYGGDTNDNGSTSSSINQTVNKASTTIALSSPASSAKLGAAVTFTVTVNAVSPSAGTPTGIVTFKNGTTTLGTATLSNGKATFSTSSLPVGIDSITAVYGGDSNFSSSTSNNVSLTITK